MNKIMGVEGEVVRVQTGVKLADLHDWLAEQVRTCGSPHAPHRVPRGGGVSASGLAWSARWRSPRPHKGGGRHQPCAPEAWWAP
jgi:hypothetical protein